MQGVPADYLGRIVSKDNFRVFIYSVSGQRKLVESWAAFETHMQSGLWFATKEDAKASVVVDAPIVAKPKRSRKKAKTAVELLEANESSDKE